MADKQLWQVTPVANDVKNDDGVIIGGQTAGTRYAPLTLIANFVHNLWAAFINAITPLETSFVSGDKITIVNGSTAKAMTKDTLLELTAQNALAGNVAQAFVPNYTTTIADELYIFNGVLYRAKENYNGVWDSNKFKVATLNDILMVLEKTQSVTRIYTEDRLVYKRLSDVTGVVQTTTSERASTPAFFVTPNSYLFVRCKGYQIRLTFWNSTAYSASTILNASAPENVAWNSGDEGIFVAAPSNAVCAMVSLRKSDNSSFETSLPQVSVYFVENQRFVAGDYDSQKVASSANGLVTLPQKVLIFDKKYYQSAFYVHVNVPSGKRARVIFGYGNTSSTYYDVGTMIALDWVTANDSVRLPIGANWFCVEFANSDGSAVNMADFKEAYCLGADTSFFGKRLSILGDSISTFGGSVDDPDGARYAVAGDPTYPGNRCRYPQTDLGLTDVNTTYWYRIMHDFGMELGISESWAGSCVSNTQETDSGDLGPNRCMSSQTRINHLAYNGTPDIILVYGGTNDYGRQFPLGTFDYTNVNGWSDAQIAAMPNGTFAEAYKAMLTRIQKTYPNAKVYCIAPNFTGGDMGRLDTYVEVVKEACDFFGVQCIDIRDVGINVFNRGSYLNDNLHPNPLGMLLIAEKIRKAMLFA